MVVGPSEMFAPLPANSALFADCAATLTRHNANNPASSMRVARAIVAAEPPDSAQGEITDKGSVNQRRVLQNRDDDVARLYAEPPAPGTILL